MGNFQNDVLGWRGWPVVAVITAVLAVIAVTALLLDSLGLWDRWFGKPALTLTAPREPGVLIEYDPAAKTLALNVSFLAENHGAASETVQSIRGSLDSPTTPVIDFTAADAECKVAEGKWPAIPIDAPPQMVLCRFRQGLTTTVGEKLKAPGPLVLNVNVQGQRDATYSLRYCLTESDAFWREFLASRKKSTRVLVNPHDCG